MELVLYGILVVVVCYKRFLYGCESYWALAVFFLFCFLFFNGWLWVFWVLMGCCQLFFGRSG